jgi:hypothetical protein
MLRSLFSRPEPAKAPAPDASLELIEPFDQKNLARFAEIDSYKAATPFPHLVFDDLFNPRALDRVLSEWPTLRTPEIDPYDDGTYSKHKYASNFRTQQGPYTRYFLSALAEPRFLEVLEKVTGVVGLIPDPYMAGGGLHFTATGGKLAIHADFNKHYKFKLDRRLNLLVYLNHGWTDENRGWLELWDRNMQNCVQRVLPVFNRTVIFSTTDESFHGQPEPIQGPPDLFRKSIAVYYYSNGRPAEEITGRDPSDTLWQQRPGSGY